MASTAKSNRGTRNASPAAPLAEVVQRGMEDLINAQKTALDILAAQNAAAFKMVRKACEMAGSAPAAAFAEGAEQVVASFTAAQKSILDFAVGRSGIVIQAGEFSSAKLAAALADAVQQSVEAIAASQKTILDLAASHQQILTGMANRQMDSLGGGSLLPFAVSVRKGLDGCIDLQQKFFDLAAGQSAAVFNTAAEATFATPAREFADLARKGMDALVETQKRLLDIASQGAVKVAMAVGD